MGEQQPISIPPTSTGGVAASTMAGRYASDTKSTFWNPFLEYGAPASRPDAEVYDAAGRWLRDVFAAVG